MKKTFISTDKVLVAVVGGHRISREVEEKSTKLGYLLAKMGVFVVCGGLGGVMSAVSKGVRDGGGMTIGLLPSDRKNDANPFIDIPIATGLGNARNTLVVGCADVVVALPGQYGTLSEVAFALNAGKPVIGLGSWEIPGVVQVKTPEAAVKKVRAAIAQLKR